MPTTTCAGFGSQARYVFRHSNTGIAVTIPTRGVHACPRNFSTFLPFVVRGLALCRSPAQGAPPNHHKIVISELYSEL
jgi:hypothetical protein